MTAVLESRGTGGDNNNRVPIPLAILVILIVIIIVVSGFTNRIRPSVITTASVSNQRRREEERYREEIRSFLLRPLPVVRYSTMLPPSEQSDSEVHNSAWNATPSRRQFQSTTNGEKPRAVYIEAAGIGGTRQCRSETLVNDSCTPEDKIRIPPQGDALQNGVQSGSRAEPDSCSVCTENFAERENVRILPCGHVYHQRCIDPWLLDFGGTCPLW